MVSLSEIRARYSNKEYFEILNLPQQLGELRAILGCEPSRIKGFNFASDRILSILQNSCSCVLLEKQYLDDESLDSYSAFYAKSFRRYERMSTRLHFFGKNIPLENLHGLVINSENELIIEKELFDLFGEDNYLGFTVLRSFDPPTLGRTYIKPSLKTTEFILCDTTTRATLAGIPLNIKASPFMQQDQRVSCCATIAIWVASESMHQRFKNGHYSTLKITELANRYRLTQGRPLPTQGLSIEQMNWALLGMGYDPISYGMGGTDVENSNVAKSIIYTYIESNLPVILAIKNHDGGHAVTVVGHGFIANKKPKKSLKDQPFFSASVWVPYFIIQNDQEGPYTYLKFENKLPNILDGSFPVLTSDNFNFDSKNNTEYGLVAIVVPHPTRIYTSGREVEFIKVGAILRTIHDAFELHVPPLPFPGNIVLRTFLISANEFKQSLLKRNDMSTDLIALYRNKIMPKYIWVSEISTVDYRNQQLNNNAHKILGEILIDPTSTPQEYDFISIHLSGYFFEMFPSDRDPYAPFLEEGRWIPINDKRPYLSLIRH